MGFEIAPKRSEPPPYIIVSYCEPTCLRGTIHDRDEGRKETRDRPPSTKDRPLSHTSRRISPFDHCHLPAHLPTSRKRIRYCTVHRTSCLSSTRMIESSNQSQVQPALTRARFARLSYNYILTRYNFVDRARSTSVYVDHAHRYTRCDAPPSLPTYYDTIPVQGVDPGSAHQYDRVTAKRSIVHLLIFSWTTSDQPKRANEATYR